ncbi:sulfatase-like hydrolase/transferase [bacterium]|jgi:hypothetical protein|nr:sulfatase-like hydrolase/transferase [bacterium]
MLQTLKKVFYCPIVCILFAIYPIIHFWSHNWEEVFAQEIIILFSAFIIFAFIVYKVFRYICKDKAKAILVTLLFLIMFISFEWFFNPCGNTYLYLYSIKFCGMIVGRFRVLIALWIIIFVAVATLIYRIKRPLKLIIFCLKIYILILLCMTLPKILYSAINESSILTKSKHIDIEAPSKQDLAVGYKPNIYYIILDAYTRSDTLQTLFDYDNSEFTNYLNKKGFFVANKSCSNYFSTSKSIPSSMNMNYAPPDKSYEHFPSEALSNSNLISALKKLGYYIINISSRTGFTSKIKSADLTLNEYPFSDFTREILIKTILGPLVNSYFIKKIEFINKKIDAIIPEKGATILKQLEILKNIPTTIKNQPFFVFCHMVCPHRPFVFSSAGKIGSRHLIELPAYYKENYPNEVKWLSRKVMDVVDTILRESSQKPIIIIQGDHGSSLYYVLWRTISEENITDYNLFLELIQKIYMRERLSNLNAYYLPGEAKNLLYETITPVNSFRVVLNYYFETKLPLLEDKSCFFDVKNTSSEKYYKTGYINNININKLCKKIEKLVKEEKAKDLFSAAKETFYDPNQKFN